MSMSTVFRVPLNDETYLSNNKLDCSYILCNANYNYINRSREEVLKENYEVFYEISYQKDEYGFRGRRKDVSRIDILTIGEDVCMATSLSNTSYVLGTGTSLSAGLVAGGGTGSATIDESFTATPIFESFMFMEPSIVAPKDVCLTSLSISFPWLGYNGIASKVILGQEFQNWESFITFILNFGAKISEIILDEFH